MVTCRGFLVLLFLEAVSANSCPHNCTCLPPDQEPLRVDCSFREMVTLPLVPSSTRELYLQGNKLETIPAGAFDNLQMLDIINLSSNPWRCNCGILYLKNWLEDQVGSMLTRDVKCFTPSSLRKKSVSQLKRSELPSCSTPKRLCSDFMFSDACLFILVLVVLVICCALVTQRTKFEVKICDNSTNSPGRLPSSSYQLKRRLGRASSNVSLGAPTAD